MAIVENGTISSNGSTIGYLVTSNNHVSSGLFFHSSGTFGGGTLQIQIYKDDGSWYAIQSLTNDSTQKLSLPNGTMVRLVLSGATSPEIFYQLSCFSLSSKIIQIDKGETPVFSPADLNPFSWYDGTDLSTLSLTGSNVTQWDDKSGNGYHVTQSTVDQQPVSQAGGLLFDGSAYLENATSGIPTENITFIVAHTPQTGNSLSEEICGNDGGFEDRRFMRLNSYNLGTPKLDNTGYVQANEQDILNVMFGWLEYNGASSTAYTQLNTGTIYSQSVSATTALTDMRIGGRIPGTGKYFGIMHEILIFDYVLTETQRTNVFNYLNGKHG